MKKIQFLLVIFFAFNGCETHDADDYFTKSIHLGRNEVALSIAIGKNGESVICGYTSSVFKSTDLLAMKISSTGNTMWTKTFGGSYFDMGVDVSQSSKGDFYITGNVQMEGHEDIFLLKLNTYGQMIWADHIGGPEQNKAHSVFPDKNGGCLVAGTKGDDMMVVHSDEKGEIIWIKTLGKLKGSDIARALSVKNNGNILISGNTKSITQINHIPFITELDPNGEEKWTSFIFLTDSGFTTQYDIHDMTVIEQEGIYLAGTYIYNIFGHNKAVLIKTDVSGKLLWRKDLKYNSFSDAYYDIEQTSGRELILTGFITRPDTLNSQFFIAKTSTDGNLIWTTEYGSYGVDFGSKTSELPNGDLISVGGQRNDITMFDDVFIVKMNKDGRIK